MPVHFANFDAVFLDLDGTLLRQNTPLPGAAEVIRAVAQQQPKYAVVSNSTSGPRTIADRMAQAGLAVPEGHIFTATMAACDAAVDGSAEATPVVFNCGSKDVDELLDGRAKIAGTAAERCDAVIVGTSTNEFATASRQRDALRFVRNGARLIGVCADRVFPSERGLEFGSGALTNMIAYAAGVRPEFCGKPERRFFEDLCARLQVRPERCLMVGDNLESDIVGGKQLGMTTVLVLGGVTRREELDDLPAELQPFAVATELMDLLR